MKRRRTQRGATLVEVLTASSISAIVIVTGILTFLFGMSSWLKGQARIEVETESQRAIRVIAQELREAMAVSIDGDGLGLTYRLPEKDADGDFVVPAEWDGIERRIELSSDALQMTVDDGPPRILCTHVILQDPLSGEGEPYEIFVPGAGAVTRQIHITVATQRNRYRQEYVTSRSRETIFLRNVPELTKG